MLLNSLVSETVVGVTKPAIAEPNVGVTETEGMRAGGAFPSSYATISRQDTPTGPLDLLVVTPGRVVMGQGGAGQLEKFTSMGLEVQYGSTTPIDQYTPVETVAPIVRSVELPATGGSRMSITVDGTGSPVKKVNVLVQADGGPWKPVAATKQSLYSATWTAYPEVSGPFRWIVQVVDAYGNVATDTARGHLDKVDAPVPALGDPGVAATIVVGDRVSRSIPVGQVALGDRLTGKVIVKDVPADPAKAPKTLATGPAVVKTAPDGSTVVQIDQVFPNIGKYTLVVSVCRGVDCSEVSFPVDVKVANSFPTAAVSLGSAAFPDSTLTATATGSDPDADDTVTLSYSWKRNGIPLLPAVTTPTLALASIGAQPGDVIEVAATPSDGKATGHIALAQITVETEPPPPTIEAKATNALGQYFTGWSASPVRVEFTCTGQGFTCPASQTVSADTTDQGENVVGEVTVRGHTVRASVLVFVDRTAPTITAKANPPTVAVGGTVTIDVVASDVPSGLGGACDLRNAAHDDTRAQQRRVQRDRQSRPHHDGQGRLHRDLTTGPHVRRWPRPHCARSAQRRRLERVPSDLRRAGDLPRLRRGGQADRHEELREEGDSGLDGSAAEGGEGQRALVPADRVVHLPLEAGHLGRADPHREARQRQEVHLPRRPRRWNIDQCHFRGALMSITRRKPARRAPFLTEEH